MERAGECITAAGVAAAVDAVLERFLPEDEDAPCTSAEALAALQALGEVESRLAARRLDLAASVFYDRAVEDSRSVERSSPRRVGAAPLVAGWTRSTRRPGRSARR